MTNRHVSELDYSFDSDDYRQIFDELDLEGDGEIYIRHAVERLWALNCDLRANYEVNAVFQKYLDKDEVIIDFDSFCKLIDEAKKVGWSRFKKKKPGISDLDIKGVFKLVDIDKSGAISKLELRMGAKYLGKRYGIHDYKSWRELMEQGDKNKDGKLSFSEFKRTIRYAERLAEQERLQREQSGEEKLEDTNENSDSNENTIDIETDGTQGPSTS